ncbi:putative methyltransferase-domain-containing protein [Aspergillus pseudonomiae]|uniref:Putative methyltransferase-domain-containing protein n=1 Tax=Aspergillus pseudonomiae TaxID=1506151 RepID=A0A5N7DEY8_9EURO|nr:putative methyltransferase-domain-containing protein [Aspergillus pseudonomiae]KAE8404228.1 putative methyltransferase-domain-containing protein [Aspergillus pseudonomiae]
MVYYIRFLKTPRVQKQKAGSLSISALICITTDLGDAFLAQDVDLVVSLTLKESEKVLHQEPLSWKAGKRELAILLGPFHPQLSQHAIVLSVAAADRGKHHPPSPDNLLGNPGVPLVISGWSAPFGGSESLVAEKLVERRFGPKGRLDLRIWEETGNSIARHIWDAAIASVMCLQQLAAGDSAITVPLLSKLLQAERNAPLRVIELGSGCGIVGIALAQILPQCSVLLTDLPEVEEIVAKNIAVAKPTPSSNLEYRTLDWDEVLPEDLCNGSIDLVLVSDCTYNADSLPALISVLDRLVQSSPDAIVLVALKRRHESETVFFDLMESSGLSNLHHHSMQLPSQHDQSDQIELYCYGNKTRHPKSIAT